VGWFHSTTSGQIIMEIIYGTAGDDKLGPLQGEQTFYGLEGNDTIEGGQGDDVIFGGPGNDTIDGGQGADVIEGGLGNDALTGGQGADTFSFNFTLQPASALVTVSFRDGNMPSENADWAAWNNYTKQLEAWRAEMEATHAQGDADPESVLLALATAHGGGVKKPMGPVPISGDNTFSYYEDGSQMTIQGEGYDTILDWSNNDKLKLAGLSDDASADNYWGKWLSVDDVADSKTVITFDGGSITLMGTDTTIAQLIADGQVLWA
jgi:hypothetical protein